jgi:hypothetical protein
MDAKSLLAAGLSRTFQLPQSDWLHLAEGGVQKPKLIGSPRPHFLSLENNHLIQH